MNTQQLIAAIKAATKTIWTVADDNPSDPTKLLRLDPKIVSYIDADAFLAAVEGLASVPDSLKGKL